MSEIDWSKAPEGATKYYPETQNHVEHWLKKEGDKWLVWTAHGGRWFPHIDPVDPVYEGIYYDKPAPEWSGEGLPPVGAVCEAKVLDGTGNFVWRECRVIHHHPRHAMSAAVAHGNEELLGWADYFRPLRTPEQIAAEEREKAAKQICIDAGSPELTRGQMAIAYRLYDHGYRKVEGGAE